jgi:hypothetical protein
VFGNNKRHALDPPDLSSDKDAREILRVWVKPEWSKMGVALQTANPDPGVWGIALVDIARHAAKAYALNGTTSESAALLRIRELFDAEWSSPTEMPEGRLRE